MCIEETILKEDESLIYTVTLNPALDMFVDAPNFRPGTVNIAAGLRRVWGGKGLNVTRVLKNLGAPCFALGIACGTNGDGLLHGLMESGIEADFVRAGGETRTNIKITDPVTGVTTDINQPGPDVSQDALDELFDRLRSRVKAGDTVALCGSLPKGAPEGIYGKWAEQLKAAGAFLALDASKNALKLGLSARPDVIKPNIDELSELVGRKLSSAEDALSVCESIVDGGTGLVALSLGEAGALFVNRAGHVYVPGLTVNVYSTTGAGDALLAALLFALNQDQPLKDAAAFAVAVSAAQVSTPPGEALQSGYIEELLARAKERMAKANLKDAFKG